jgi:hypothetical protein
MLMRKRRLLPGAKVADDRVRAVASGELAKATIASVYSELYHVIHLSFEGRAPPIDDFLTAAEAFRHIHADPASRIQRSTAPCLADQWHRSIEILESHSLQHLNYDLEVCPAPLHLFPFHRDAPNLCFPCSFQNTTYPKP